MSTSAECRRFAKECVELAQNAQCEQHRTMLLEMAEKWLRFADAERTGGSKPSQPAAPGSV